MCTWLYSDYYLLPKFLSNIMWQGFPWQSTSWYNAACLRWNYRIAHRIIFILRLTSYKVCYTFYLCDKHHNVASHIFLRENSSSWIRIFIAFATIKFPFQPSGPHASFRRQKYKSQTYRTLRNHDFLFHFSFDTESCVGSHARSGGAELAGYGGRAHF